ncbi:MAG: HD domain-containing protein [Candidatus Neomarinimicrobiota bacterium]
MITDILPEVNKINDAGLRSKVIAVWEEAMAFRGWTPEILSSIPFTLLAENVRITFIEHVRTVCKMCIACDEVLTSAYRNRKTPIQRDYLIAGALLADVGKLFEYEIVDGKATKSDFGKKLRHPFSGVGLAFKHDLPPEVLHIIATHSKEGDAEKRSPESIIFHHVDFIDFEIVK